MLRLLGRTQRRRVAKINIVVVVVPAPIEGGDLIVVVPALIERSDLIVVVAAAFRVGLVCWDGITYWLLLFRPNAALFTSCLPE